MVLDDGIDDCQAETAAFLLGREIWIEYSVYMFFCYSRPLILNHYPDVSSGRETQVTARLDVGVLAAYGDDAAFRHNLIRVNGQIVNHLANLTGIHMRRPKIVWKVELAPDIRASQCKQRGFPYQGINFSILSNSASVRWATVISRNTRTTPTMVCPASMIGAAQSAMLQ